MLLQQKFTCPVFCANLYMLYLYHTAAYESAWHISTQWTGAKTSTTIQMEQRQKISVFSQINTDGLKLCKIWWKVKFVVVCVRLIANICSVALLLILFCLCDVFLNYIILIYHFRRWSVSRWVAVCMSYDVLFCCAQQTGWSGWDPSPAGWVHGPSGFRSFLHASRPRTVYSEGVGAGWS